MPRPAPTTDRATRRATPTGASCCRPSSGSRAPRPERPGPAPTSRRRARRLLQTARSRQLLQQRLLLGHEAGHRFLVVVGRKAPDQVAVAEGDVRRQHLGDILRRAHRLVLPRLPGPVALEGGPEAAFRLGAVVADEDDAGACRALDLGRVAAHRRAMLQEDRLLAAYR